MAIRLVTFDLDDTLWPMRPLLISAEARMRAWIAEHAPQAHALIMEDEYRQWTMQLRNELIVTQPKLKHHISDLRTEILKHTMLRAGFDQQQARSLAQRAFDEFMHGRHAVALFDDVIHTLQELQKLGLAIGALSNGNADLKRLPVAHYFDFHFSAETVGAAKPDPRMFNHALEAAGASANEALHIGDHIDHDVAAAHNAGFNALWLQRPELLAAADNKSIHDPSKHSVPTKPEAQSGKDNEPPQPVIRIETLSELFSHLH